MSVNGVLAGLVAITAPCAFVNPLGAVIIGLVAGVLVCLASMALEKSGCGSSRTQKSTRALRSP
jgi:Amt family ammonium transporter